MSLFDTLIVQPIFNLLMAIYAILPGNDFGISLIIFSILVRLLMWPLIKKQLRQTKVMRAIQPELKKIKAKAKGNKQEEGRLMLELYRERGVNPFSSFGVLLVQLPIFIALFSVIKIITNNRDTIGAFTYSFIDSLEPIRQIVADPHSFNESLLGLVDLTKVAIGQDGSITISLVILSLLSAIFQYIQSKQITPVPTDSKKLRDIFKDSAAGKNVDQSEVSAVLTQRLILVLPVVAFAVALFLPGALVLFYATSSLVAVIQQHYILKEDVAEMEVIADKQTKTATTSKPKNVSEKTKVRVFQAEEAEIVKPAKKTSKKKKKKR